MRPALIALAALAAAGTARAEPPRVVPPRCALAPPLPPPRGDTLATRVAFGRIAVGGEPLTTMGFALALDQPVLGRWRVLAEYELLWLGAPDRPYADTGVGSMTRTGHRAGAGVRRELAARPMWGLATGFVDGEAGGGIALIDGSVAIPHAFAGLRLGLSFAPRSARSGARWEYELVFRGLSMPGGLGGVFGIGLVWE